MKATKRSKKLLGELLNVNIPKTNELKKFKPDQIVEVEHDGLKFVVCYRTGYVYMGLKTELRKSTWGDVTGYKLYCSVDGPSGSDQSCAYARYRPVGTDVNTCKMQDWWLQNVPIKKGCTCYLTKNDGLVKPQLESLKKRGFRCVSVNKSIHAGGYSVYLLVHPGDDFYRKTNTIRVDVFPHVEEEDAA